MKEILRYMELGGLLIAMDICIGYIADFIVRLLDKRKERKNKK